MAQDLIAAFEAGLPATLTPQAVSVALDRVVRESFGGKIYATFNGKIGRWVAGQDKEDVTGEEAIIVLGLTKVQQVAWKDASGRQLIQPLKTPAVQVGSAIPETEGVTGNPNATLGLSVPAFLLLDGELVPTLIESSSQGFRKAVSAFAKEIGSQCKEGFLPRVTLEVSSYKHPSHGTIYTPTLKLKDFVPEADLRESV
jgi:hypothetical protein